MRRLARRATGALLVLLLAAAGASAAFTLRSEVDARRIGVADHLELTITLEGSSLPDAVSLPALTNLEVVGGPSQSTQVSIVNGSMSQGRTYTYVLRPRGVGRAEIGAVRAGDQTAPAIAIEVVAGSIRPREAGPTARSARRPVRSGSARRPVRADVRPLAPPRGRAEPKLLMEALSLAHARCASASRSCSRTRCSPRPP